MERILPQFGPAGLSHKGPLWLVAALWPRTAKPSLLLIGAFVGCHMLSSTLLQVSRYKAHRTSKLALLYTPAPPNPPSHLVL